MRTVLVYLRQVTEQEVIAYLDRVCAKGACSWLYPDSERAVMYVDFYRDLNSEGEVEDYFALLDCLGEEPNVCAGVDISGRFPGDAEVRAFVCQLLNAFSGIAQDEYTNHCWTCEQIQQNILVQGHGFFDYKGLA